MFDHRTATDKIFDRVHRTGEEIKNDLPNWVERFIAAEGWKQVIDPSTGKPFADIGKWLVANWPLGPGMGHGRYSISYDEFISLCSDRPTLKDMLVKFRPKRQGKRTDLVDNVNEVEKQDRKTGNSRLYIEERLQRDHPEIWQEYLSGKIKSARQAAIKAGFVKDTHDPLMRMKSYWAKASKKQKNAFKKWIAEN
jgi:hypothetical protein